MICVVGAGFDICAIEVSRSDNQMEIVAIATDDAVARELEGQSSPLDAMYPVIDLGEVVGAFGAGDEALGMLSIARAPGSAGWTDGESSAALDVGHDLGRAILNTRASQRERDAVAELRRVDDYRTGLIATLAHELKNPIGVVAGHAEMLASLADGEDLPPGGGGLARRDHPGRRSACHPRRRPDDAQQGR